MCLSVRPHGTHTSDYDGFPRQRWLCERASLTIMPKFPVFLTTCVSLVPKTMRAASGVATVHVRVARPSRAPKKLLSARNCF